MTTEERQAKRKQLEIEREKAVAHINMINGYLECLADIDAAEQQKPSSTLVMLPHASSE